MLLPLIVQFLDSFFCLFGAKIEWIKFFDGKIMGTIGWLGEDDKQDFCYKIELEESILINLKMLCEYLVKNHLIDGDRIGISESELKIKLLELGWDINEAQKNINYLCSVEVKMVDDGEETDSFFIHF